MTEVNAVSITMPLCRSAKGLPIVIYPTSQFEDQDWDSLEPIVRRRALEHLENLREQHHGAAAQLPTLDPNAWELVSTNSSYSGYDHHELQLRETA